MRDTDGAPTLAFYIVLVVLVILSIAMIRGVYAIPEDNPEQLNSEVQR